jgi:hypothetical protein
MPKEEAIIPIGQIERRILLLREQRVILDSDLARLYGVTSKRLNEQVKRNHERFPRDFAFQLTPKEYQVCLKSQFATSLGLSMADLWGSGNYPFHPMPPAAKPLLAPMAVATVFGMILALGSLGYGLALARVFEKKSGYAAGELRWSDVTEIRTWKRDYFAYDRSAWHLS